MTEVDKLAKRLEIARKDLYTVKKESLIARRANVRLRDEILTLRELISKWDFMDGDDILNQLKVLKEESEV